MIDAEAKRSIAKERRDAAREKERRERRCFWTWPWGHQFRYVNSEWTCIVPGCEKTLEGY